MAIEAKITLNNEEFKKGLKDSERQATSSMKKIGGSSGGAGSVMASIANASKNAADIAAKGFSGVTEALSKMGPYGVAAAAAVTLIGGAATGVLKGVNALASPTSLCSMPQTEPALRWRGYLGSSARATMR